MVNKTNENTTIMLKSMAVGFYDGGNDDGDNGGNDPLIRELDLDDVVSRVPPELLEPSQPPAEPEEMTADLTPNPGESPGEREGVGEVPIKVQYNIQS